MSINKRFNEERQRLKKSEIDFGECCGQTKAAVVAWEKGQRYPELLTLALLAKNGVDVQYILTGEAGPCSQDDRKMLTNYLRCRDSDKQTICELVSQKTRTADEIEAEASKNRVDLFKSITGG